MKLCDCKQTIMGHLATFSSRLSSSLYLAAEKAFKLGGQLTMDSDQASVFRRIAITCDLITALSLESNAGMPLYEDLSLALDLLRASNNPDGGYFVIQTFITDSEINEMQSIIDQATY